MVRPELRNSVTGAQGGHPHVDYVTLITSCNLGVGYPIGYGLRLVLTERLKGTTMRDIRDRNSIKLNDEKRELTIAELDRIAGAGGYSEADQALSSLIKSLHDARNSNIGKI
ncbi:hypothetical protein [Bradyrhizobium manausense]|uniref:hypothetical protein n=1 Tax=Bradyrhizobium manausense TaxID=989370 RepID=UPI000710B78A|nr:hypothetical protein [Bradyrhizobium manausense]